MSLEELFEAALNGNGDTAGTSWHDTDLGPSWRGEKVEPAAVIMRRSDGRYLFPVGINYLFGDSGDGKSLILLLATVEAIRAGQHVIWLTYEDPNELEVVKRLRLLGATFEEVDTYLHVIIGIDPLTSGVGYLAHLARATGAALLVLDSIGEALAVDGIDEDRDSEFGPWARETLRHILDLAASETWDNAHGTPPNPHLSIIPIDHSTKAKDNPLYPSGTKRKRAIVTGLMLMINVRQPFAVDRIGLVQLICAKDRTGRFRRGQIVAEVTIDATCQEYAHTIEPPPEGGEMSRAGRKRSAEDRVLQALENSTVPLTAAETQRLVNDENARLPGESDMGLGTVRNAMTRLAKRANVTLIREPAGNGKAVRHLYKVTESEENV